jgi:hypothetical protein
MAAWSRRGLREHGSGGGVDALADRVAQQLQPELSVGVGVQPNAGPVRVRGWHRREVGLLRPDGLGGCGQLAAIVARLRP